MMKAIITLIMLAAVFFFGCANIHNAVIAPMTTAGFNISRTTPIPTFIPTPIPTFIPTPIPTPIPTTPSSIIPFEQEKIYSPHLIDPNKIKLKLDIVGVQPAQSTAQLSLLIENGHDFDLNNLDIYFVQSGGTDPESWSKRYNLPAGKIVWDRILIRPYGERWIEMAYYIELDGKMVELTNYTTSWEKS